MKKEFLEGLKLRLLYLKYARALNIDSYATFVNELDMIRDYLNNGYSCDSISYHSYKERKLKIKATKEIEKTTNKKAMFILNQLLSQALDQNDNLASELQIIYARARNLSAFYPTEDEVMQYSIVENDDGSSTYLIDTYVTSCGGIPEIQEVSIKIDMTSNDEVHRIELIRLMAPSPRSIRRTYRTIIEDIEQDECLISKDVYSKESYFNKNSKDGEWINESVEIVPKEKNATKQKQLIK